MEVLATTVGELKENLQEVTVSGKQVLFAKTTNGNIFATSSKCPHYGAPLVKGVLSGDRIVCPWHGACFSVTTGDIEDHPTLDCLHSFPTRIDGNDVYITLPAADSVPQQRNPKFASKQATTEQVVAIIGGGAAGVIAAETLRTEGFTGRVIILSAEKYLPYDRPKLSKNMAVKADAIALRPKAFYEEIGVELRLDAKVTELDAATKTIALADGSSLKYDEAIVATGSRPFNIPVPGHDLQNVFILRNPDDSAAIEASIDSDTNVVIVGTGFIGLEAATYLKTVKKVKNVTAVSLDKYPLDRVLGESVGKIFKTIHEEQGVVLKLGVHLQSYVGNNGKVTGVVLQEEKDPIPADVVIVGAGVRLNTEFLKNVELHDKEKSVIVDEHLRSKSGVYAVGDIARFPNYYDSGNLTRIEHWGVAQNQGRVAALNILGKSTVFKTVPYFWTVQFPGALRYVGHVDTFEDVIVVGKPEEKKFVALYIHDGKVAAVATLGRDPIASTASELFRLGKFPSLVDVGKYPDAASLATLLEK